MARFTGVLGGIWAALALLAWLAAEDSGTRSLGSFSASLGVFLLALLHTVIALTSWRAARRGKAGPLGVAAALPVALIGLVIILGAAGSATRGSSIADSAMTLGDVRTLLSAEASYAHWNHGYFDRPACLVRFEDCRPGAPRDAWPLLSEQDLAEVRHGYRRTFHPGPPAPATEVTRLKASPTSLRAFAYVAVPTDPARFGMRAFCGGSDGAVCAREDGSMPRPIEGKCPTECSQVR